ncbi:MAG: hypothetical protein Q9170_007682 [Blastenia crenularia]
MEATALAIGIASLYNACSDIIARLDAYKHFGTDSRTTIALFDTSKIRLQDWAQAVGIENGKLADHHDYRLDDPTRVPIIINILECLKKLFDRVRHVTSSIKLPIRQQSAGNENDGWVLPFDETGSTEEYPQPLSKKSRLLWSLGKKEKLDKDVLIFEALLNSLYHIIDPTNKPGDHWSESPPSIESSRPLSEPEAALREIQKSLVELDRRHVLNWLDALKYDDEYEKHMSSHLNGTCKWILSHPAYVSWAPDATADTGAKFLWIHGPAGFGKTVLSAFLIQQIKNTSKTVAYCFSSSHARRTDEFDGIIRTWITQLVQCDDRVLDVCRTAHRNQSTRRASRSDAWNILREVSAQAPSCVLVLDGLDEFSADDTRHSFLRDVKKVVTSTRVKVLITSRNELDIESELSMSAAQPISQLQHWSMFECKVSKNCVKDDIDLYSQSMVTEKFIKQDIGSRQELSAQMARRADGMFLWIKLQQHQLRGTQSKKTVQRLIEGMPRGLDQTYRRNWQIIQEAAEPDRIRAVNILRWLTFGFRPLTVQELSEALVIELDEASEAFRWEDLPLEINFDYSNHEIKGLCRSLVELRDNSQNSDPRLSTVHLVHNTIRDYLFDVLPRPIPCRGAVFPDSVHRGNESHASQAIGMNSSLSSRELQSSVQHVMLAAYCLRYLNCPQAWLGNDKNGHFRSFTAYAVRSWYKHLQRSEDHYHSVSSLVHDFMRPGNVNFRKWQKEIRIHSNEERNRDHGGTDNEDGIDNESAMYFACLLGLIPTMDSLHTEENEAVNHDSRLLGIALEAACVQDNIRAFDRLIKWGADVTVQRDQYRNPLNAAAYYGRYHIVKTLLELGVRQQASISQQLGAIVMAARQGHTDVVRLLLDQNVGALQEDASAQDEQAYLSDALLWAARNGHTTVANVLLERGADKTACTDDKFTPLHIAAGGNHLAIVNLLLNQASSMQPHASEIPPNHLQVLPGSPAMMAEIIEKRTDYGDTALHIAARRGNTEVVAYLVARRAAIDSRTSGGSTPIFLATYQEHLEVVAILLDSGANVDVGDAEDFLPIHIAAGSGNVDIVRLLIEKGVDFNRQNNAGWTALQMATDRGQEAVVKLLLDHGAKMIPDKEGWAPLHFSCNNVELEVTRVLLQAGADPNARAQQHATPLNLVIHASGKVDQGHRLKLVELLLEHGAQDIPNSDGWYPLHGAASFGYHQIINLLLDQGHAINNQSNSWHTPLQMAIYRKNTDVVKLLLRRGANPHLLNKDKETALHAATVRGELEIVQILLANHCDPNLQDEFRCSPLQYAITSNSPDELARELIHSGADLSVEDGYGMTCADWHQRIRPHLSISQQDFQPSGPDEAKLKYRTWQGVAELIECIKGTQEQCSWTFYRLSKAFLLLGMEDEARLAYEAQLLRPDKTSVLCDNCDRRQTKENPVYTCKICPQSDLCDFCMASHEETPILELCREHGFLRIMASEARVRPDQPEAFMEWLLSSEEKLRPAGTQKRQRPEEVQEPRKLQKSQEHPILMEIDDNR